MASLKDVARALDVSVSLVSKVLSNRLGTTGVRPELVDAIRAKAKELGYRRNASAASLRRGRHDAFGVFIHKIGRAGSGTVEALLEGIAAAAFAARQKEILSFYGSAEEFQALRPIAHRSIMDGLLVGGLLHAELVSALSEIRQSGTPVVTVYDHQVADDLPNVGMDQAAVSKAATRHLIERGARHIAHVSCNKDRLKGYLQAMAEAGLQAGDPWIYHAGGGGYGHEIGEAAAISFLERDLHFDGLVAQSDEQAAGALNVLCSRGKRVPEEIRVIGIDNAPYCEFTRVPLSSVSQRFRERGETAVSLLLKAIEGVEAESVELAPMIVERASSR